MYFNAADIAVHVQRIKIKDGQVWIEANEETPIPLFDPEHIRLNKLNGSINGFHFVKDTMRANIDLSVKDRSGFELKKLQARFRFTPQIMELGNLNLQTNKSKLGSYYAMKYRDFNHDFGEYETDVTMVANFKEAKVHSDDVAYFAPELSDLHKLVELSGNFNGTVTDFQVKNLAARGGTGSILMENYP